MIRYINTDLDVVSHEDLTPLALRFQHLGAPPLYLTHGEDGLWYTSFETDQPYDEAVANIAALLDVVESLDETGQRVWNECRRREINVGHECGLEPWAFTNAVSSETVRRMAELRVAFRITLYPPEETGQGL